MFYHFRRNIQNGGEDAFIPHGEPHVIYQLHTLLCELNGELLAFAKKLLAKVTRLLVFEISECLSQNIYNLSSAMGNLANSPISS